MNNKYNNLIEKFKTALTSTAKVISDDLELNKSDNKKKSLESSNFEINNLTKPTDLIRLRAETDSSALKKKFSNKIIYQKNLPSNPSSRSLYNIAEKIRYESLGGKMLKGVKKNFNENYTQIIHLKKKRTIKK